VKVLNGEEVPDLHKAPGTVGKTRHSQSCSKQAEVRTSLDVQKKKKQVRVTPRRPILTKRGGTRPVAAVGIRRVERRRSASYLVTTNVLCPLWDVAVTSQNDQLHPNGRLFKQAYKSLRAPPPLNPFRTNTWHK
jgi:hypothetical protein